MRKGTRQIGPIGTAARVLTALALLYIAGDGSIAPWGNGSIAPWGIESQDAVIGLLVLPALMIGVGLVARRYAAGPIRFTGPLGTALNLAVIVALIANDLTGGGGGIFCGGTNLLGA